MRFIPTKIHGILDYLLAILFIAVPWLFGFYGGGVSTNVFVCFGVAIVIYSLFTHYETGIIRIIPVRIHLMIDILGGLILATSPWVLGFADHVFLPHLILGLLSIGAGLTTEKEPRLPPKPDTVPSRS